MKARGWTDKATENMPYQSIAQPACRLVRATGGHVSIEYALVLALLICAVVSAALLLGTAQRRSLGQFAQQVKQPDVERKRPGTIEARGEEVESVRGRLLLISLILGSLGLWSIARLLARRPHTEGEPSTASIGNEATQARYVDKRQQILRAFRNNLQHLQVRHVMTDRVATASPATPLEELAQLMSDQGVWQVIICNSSGEPLGIVSHRFLKGARGKRAMDVMSDKPITVTPDMDLSVAITLLLERNLSCVPVVCEGKLRGMVTNTELAMGFQVLIQLLHQVPSDALATP